jgi:hypothetical protein
MPESVYATSKSSFRREDEKIFRLLPTASIRLAMVLALASTCYASSTSGQQRGSRTDALEFCGDELPDVDRIAVCMAENIK